MEKKLMAAKKKARPHAPSATVNIAVRVIARPVKPRIMNPSKGKSSTYAVKFVIIH
jgi:hypothetical protein